MQADSGPFHVSPFVLAEVDYLLSDRLGTAYALNLLEDIAAGAYQLAAFGEEDLVTAISIARQYADLAVGLTDASVVVIAARHRTDRILTLDDHFRAVRPLQGGAFTLLPADV